MLHPVGGFPSAATVWVMARTELISPDPGATVCRRDARMLCSQAMQVIKATVRNGRIVVDEPTGAAEIAWWSVTFERGWFSGCGTQLTARMLGRRLVGCYIYMEDT